MNDIEEVTVMAPMDKTAEAEVHGPTDSAEDEWHGQLPTEPACLDTSVKDSCRDAWRTAGRMVCFAYDRARRHSVTRAILAGWAVLDIQGRASLYDEAAADALAIDSRNAGVDLRKHYEAMRSLVQEHWTVVVALATDLSGHVLTGDEDRDNLAYEMIIQRHLPSEEPREELAATAVGASVRLDALHLDVDVYRRLQERADQMSLSVQDVIQMALMCFGDPGGDWAADPRGHAATPTAALGSTSEIDSTDAAPSNPPSAIDDALTALIGAIKANGPPAWATATLDGERAYAVFDAAIGCSCCGKAMEQDLVCGSCGDSLAAACLAYLETPRPSHVAQTN